MKRTRFRPVSKQKASDNIKYREAKEIWQEKRIGIDTYLRCQFIGNPYAVLSADREGRCIETAMAAPHHRKGRHGSLLYNQRYFLAVCWYHHRFIHDNLREARKRGYVLWT